MLLKVPMLTLPELPERLMMSPVLIEVVVPAGASEGAALATFQGKDPDPGTVFRYRLVEGNGDEAFELDAQTGVLKLRGKGRHPARTVVVEAQDNCIPLSSARAACRITFP